MAEPYITIVSSAGTISSNELSSAGVGVEVQAGVTGLGLPAVALQFDESAGEGARYRGGRVLQRSIDLRIHATGPTRASFKAVLDRVTKVLAEQVTVTFHDPDASEEYLTQGYRSGGGDYAYGVDSATGDDDGFALHWVNLDFTIQTESPYWERVQPVTLSRSDIVVQTSNPGTAPSPATWQITGPCQGFRATSPNGDKLEYAGFIDTGTVITIDGQSGTVYDQFGNSRYNELGALPRFFKIGPGDSNVTVEVDQNSGAYQSGFTTPRKNHVQNPAFNVDATGWASSVGWEFDNVNKRYNQTTAQTATRPRARTLIHNLIPGKNYVVRVDGQLTAGTYPPNTKKRTTQIVVWDSNNGVRVNALVGEVIDQALVTFTATTADATLEVYPESGELPKSAGGAFLRSTGWIDSVYLGDPGPYFDGNTVDTPSMNYAWSAAANNSASTATPVVLPPTGGAQVDLTFKPRKWLVI